MRLHSGWRQLAWQSLCGLVTGPVFRRARRLTREPEHCSRHLFARSCQQLSRRLPRRRAHWHWRRRRSGHHSVLADALFWIARFFHSLRPHLDVLCRRGSHWSGHPRPCLRFDRLLHFLADCPRSGLVVRGRIEPFSSKIFELIRNRSPLSAGSRHGPPKRPAVVGTFNQTSKKTVSPTPCKMTFHSNAPARPSIFLAISVSRRPASTRLSAKSSALLGSSGK